MCAQGGAPKASSAKPPSKASGGKKAKAKDGKKSKSKKPLWVHGQLNKEEAKQLLSDATNGEFTTGAFLFRKRAGPGYVLSVCFKGKDTHHNVSRASKEEPWKVGKHDIPGSKSIGDVRKALQAKKAWWPVPLVTPVEREEEGAAAPEKDAEAAQAVVEAAGEAKDGDAEGGNDGDGDAAGGEAKDGDAEGSQEGAGGEADGGGGGGGDATKESGDAVGGDDDGAASVAADAPPDISSVDYNVAKNYDGQVPSRHHADAFAVVFLEHNMRNADRVACMPWHRAATRNSVGEEWPRCKAQRELPKRARRSQPLSASACADLCVRLLLTCMRVLCTVRAVHLCRAHNSRARRLPR